jgi:hypothetical protein
MVVFLVELDPEPDHHTRPEFVNVIPSTRINDNELPDFALLYLVAERLNEEVYQAVRRYRPTWSRTQVANRVNGYLEMRNYFNDHHAFENDVTTENFNARFLLDMFERAQHAESNPNLRLLDVDWIFWINPASLEVGGGKAFTNSDKLGGLEAVSYTHLTLPTID